MFTQIPQCSAEASRVAGHTQVKVQSVFPNFTDPSAYLNRHELCQLLRESDQVSGVFLAVDSEQIPAMYAAVKQTPVVAGVIDKRSAMKHFRDMISESTYVMRTVNAMFAMVIAFGVIYNCAMIILSERARDLATLRVMGFTRGEASRVLVGEIAIITLMSIPLGLVIGYLFSYGTALSMDTETNRFPLVINRSTYAYSTLVILFAATLSGWYVRRLVNDLDLISVLKVKE
ncbi:FtsX-like permease family protein [Stieleria varia]|uniref:FtsX-like permease family protein n=1 Tax=Stieleria varia TaxID=2528005 RepID=A0A5C5ZW36_9BACT|nr:FtsX-like permease family protein [Stieleria varia]